VNGYFIGCGVAATSGTVDMRPTAFDRVARSLKSNPAGVWPMRFLNDPTFWDKKLQIAILALASFMALC
jgi:hypothetical protein